MPDAAGALPAIARERLAILVGSPLTENIYRRIGAEELSAHFDIIVVDCLEWVRCFSEHTKFVKKVSPNIIDARSEAELNVIFGQKRPAVVVDFLGRGTYTRSVQEACRAVGARYVTHHLVPVPAVVSSQAPLQSLLRHPWKTFGKLVRHLWRRIRCRNPYPPDVALIAGRKSENPWLISAGAVIRTATPGYFELEQVKKVQERGVFELPGLKDRQYLLFIDDCLALSFDFLLGSLSPIVTPEHYHQVLNRFFDQVEQATGLPMVIAAHPDGKEYPNYAQLFAGRPLFHGSTALLSLGCACAFTHFSSAINYAVLLRKPIAILTFDKLRAAPQGEIAALIAALLERPLLDMSSQSSSSHALLAKIMDAPSEGAYANYARAYIVDTDAPGEHPFENLVNHLKAVLGNATRPDEH
jgi:hypothetical protein